METPAELSSQSINLNLSASTGENYKLYSSIAKTNENAIKLVPGRYTYTAVLYNTDTILKILKIRIQLV